MLLSGSTPAHGDTPRKKEPSAGETGRVPLARKDLHTMAADVVIARFGEARIEEEDL